MGKKTIKPKSLANEVGREVAENLEPELRKTSMLGELNLRKKDYSAIDKDVSSEARSNHNLASDAGNFRIKPFSSADLKEITKMNNEIRAYWYKHTRPTTDGKGPRLITARIYSKVKSTMEKMLYEYGQLVRKIAQDLDQLIANQKTRMGDRFDSIAWPSSAEFVEAHASEVVFSPIPDKNWVVMLDKKELEELSQRTTQHIDRMGAIAQNENWVELLKCVEAIIEKTDGVLEERKIRGKDETKLADKTFKDSLFGNLSEVLDIVPDYNVKAQPELDKMVQELREKLDKDPEKVRKDPKLKKQVHDDAVLAREAISGFMN